IHSLLFSFTMKWARCTLLIGSIAAFQMLNSVNEVEGQAFFTRMASLSDEAKEAASGIAALFVNSLDDEDGVTDAEALDMFLALPAHVQHELKHVFPEFFEDELTEEDDRMDKQSRAFVLR
ncbi:hypothetical protein PENTCL1PPCAC_25714, partial [Pristionchus entomophagus]